jgi:signal transduction histidine kinase
MKIQVRQSLYSSIAFGVIFIIISSFIYIFYSENAQNSIYKNLEKTAYIAAFFHLEEDELNAKEFEKVREQFDEIVSGTAYQVYDTQDSIVWGNRDEEIPLPVLSKIHKEKHLHFSTEANFCYGIFYEDNQGDFIIIAKEPKDTLNEQLISLLWALLSALIFGLVAVVLLSRWLAHIAYKPFSDVIKQVRNIPANNPTKQIASPNTKDELQELTDTFNRLLEQISETFIIQKNFVSYVSHEFKTPLASMLGNLEVFSLKDRSPEEYEELSQKLISQVRQLEGILNTLIIVSDLRKDTSLDNQFRIDELIWEIIEKVSFNYANNKVDVQIDILPEDENLLVVYKDRTQLLMALFNIIENAVKYSRGEPITIKLYKSADSLCLFVKDKGIGISPEDIKYISKPFYRAGNANPIQGSGIGLSIALRILEKNDIEYEIQSQEGIGTTIALSFQGNELKNS